MKLPLIQTAALALLAPLVSAQEIKLLPNDGANGDEFGYSVAVSGNTVIVGARHDDDNGYNSGSAYLFDATTGAELAKLVSSDGAAYDFFGCSVAISENTLIIGARGDDDTGLTSGSAYIFQAGFESAKITASDAAANDWFGHSVSIDGNIVIVGAPYNDDSGSNSGSAYLFDATTGVEIAKLTASDAAANDQFGYSVDISGNTAIVGARGDDDNGLNSGSAYLFDTTTGTQSAKLTASGPTAGDQLGFSVAIDGNTAIVGAHYDGTNSGSAYIFDTTMGTQVAKLTASDAATNDRFGHSVGIDGNIAIVGAPYNDDNSDNSGAIYLYDTTIGAQIAKLTGSDPATNDQFGHSVGIDDNTIIVGAYLDDDNGLNSGSSYLFDNDCNNNGIFDPLDIASTPSLDCDQNGLLDSCELASGVGDCDSNGLFDACDCLNGAVLDCDGNLVPDVCEPRSDCDFNGTLDQCEIASDPSLDCDQNGLLDSCELANGVGDCDSNGVFDACDCLNGAVLDCDGNLVPDVCEPRSDCDFNGTLDQCEIASDPSLDCDQNGLLDSCELANGVGDCNINGVFDACECLDGSTQDCDGNLVPDVCERVPEDCDNDGLPDSCETDCNLNGTPDDCEPFEDCNANGTPDICETLQDCDSNGVFDPCQIQADPSLDLNLNGVLDLCECQSSSYCPASPNSVGAGVQIDAQGSSSITLNDLRIYVSGGPNGQPGLFYYGPGAINQPFGEGIRCVSGPITRLPPHLFFSGPGNPSGPGFALKTIDLASGAPSSGPSQIQAGSTWYFQLWYRDPQGGPWGFNLSNGLEITFCL